MIRTTQRAPRSCVPCTKRKIRCDKGVPCLPCVSRSIAKECKRETVLVRGRVRPGEAGESGESAATFEDVMQENARLRAVLLGKGQDEFAGDVEGGETGDEAGFFSSRHGVAEQYLFEQIRGSSRTRSVRTLQDIVMPSREFSQALTRHAFQWTFWIHYALFIPEFERQHAEFWERFAASGSLEDTDMDTDTETDPFWLATYFAVLAADLLFMDEDETTAASPPGIAFMDLLRNWYEAALFFLDRGDFMQNLHVGTVRTIAVLGVVFNSVGDVHRHLTLWSVALRQAQQLGLGTDADRRHAQETYVEQQARRRLWWTLVLCDWIPVPYRSPGINDVDFDCRLPDEIDDDELAAGVAPSRLPRSKPRPIRYHIAMIKVARIYYQIHCKLRLHRWRTAEVAALVCAADEQLANLIGELPPYLRSDEVYTSASRQRDLQNPFVPWQKESLSLVLLYYRMNISRLLQERWLDGTIVGTRLRAICVSSARSLIHCAGNMQDASKLRPWAVALNVFSACATLALESSGTGQGFSAEIEQGIAFLRRITSHNIVAEYGIEVLESHPDGRIG